MSVDLEELGKLSDTCDNVVHASQIPGIPLSIHVEAMSGALKEVRDRLRQIYIKESGEDPWSE